MRQFFRPESRADALRIEGRFGWAEQALETRGKLILEALGRLRAATNFLGRPRPGHEHLVSQLNEMVHGETYAHAMRVAGILYLARDQGVLPMPLGLSSDGGEEFFYWVEYFGGSAVAFGAAGAGKRLPQVDVLSRIFVVNARLGDFCGAYLLTYGWDDPFLGALQAFQNSCFEKALITPRGQLPVFE